jgi:hypothetical protein
MAAMKPVEPREADRDAFERALKMARRDPARAKQLTSMMTDRPWEEVAKFAAHCCQGKSLGLKPWQVPPCSLTDAEVWADLDSSAPEHRGYLEAQDLVRRLLRVGLSRWEPDPVAALRRAKERSNHSEPQPSKPPLGPNTREGYARDK